MVPPSASSKVAITLLTLITNVSELWLVHGTITISSFFTRAGGICTPSGGHHTVSVTSPGDGVLSTNTPLTGTKGAPRLSTVQGTTPWDMGLIVASLEGRATNCM